MKYVLPLLMFIALGSFSFSARAANDDLLNATLGQAIGQFMSKAQQPAKGASTLNRPATRGRMLHAKKLKGQQAPALPLAATPAAPAASASPVVPASVTVPSTSTSFTRPMNTLPAIAPAAGGTTPAAPAPTSTLPGHWKPLPANGSSAPAETSPAGGVTGIPR